MVTYDICNKIKLLETMKLKTFLIALTLTTGLLSFKITETKLYEFSYPKRDGTAITLSADNFKKFEGVARF